MADGADVHPVASRSRSSRSQARRAALKVLYQLDITGDLPEEGMKIFFKNHRIPPASKPFVSRLVQGTRDHLEKIDSRIAEHATNWSLERMAMVDRNILRLGAYELLFSSETPPKVVINEAVDLAKCFGTAESGKFVNGVLDSIHKAGPKSSTDEHPADG